MKRLFSITLAIFVIAASLIAAAKTNAQVTSPQSLIDQIAEKFNLNKDEVQIVAEDFHNEKLNNFSVEHKARMEEKLSEAVASGKITDAQKLAILKKHEELQKRHEAERTEMLEWSKQNGLDNLDFKMGLGMHKFGHGFGMHKWK